MVLYGIREQTQDIEKGCSYVCENDHGDVVGTFFFNHGKDIEPTYEIIDDGEWIGDDSYGVVHRIASDGSEKGIGSFCIKWALEQFMFTKTTIQDWLLRKYLRRYFFIIQG